MNPAAILGLLSDLYTQISQLQAENEGLRKAVESSRAAAGGVPRPTAPPTTDSTPTLNVQ